MGHPNFRPRRMRRLEAFRGLLRETHLSVGQLVMPLFVRSGKNVRAPIPAMPGQFQLSVDQLVKECRSLHEANVPAVILFGVGAGKDEKASGAYAKDGIVQQAVQEVKRELPELCVITDVCLCGYASHGHCGVIKTRGKGRETRGGGKRKGKSKSKKRTAKKVAYPASMSERDFWIDNDATLELLTRTAVSHAVAGADIVAPSDMMDGNVSAIRSGLDREGFDQLPIMAYSAKFASSFYGPFREAVSSAPGFGDRRSYQMDIANGEEALREVGLDIEQGADIVMVKPALAYLDIIRRIKERFAHPVAAFSVSGEYAMIKAASARGWIAERPAWLEILLSMKRSGADILITYWAKEAARFVQNK